MPDASEWTGPWSADVTTAARGLEEINARLAEGWRIIWCSIQVEELSFGGQSRRQTRAWRPLALLGRRFAEGEGETERAVALKDASEAGGDALSDASAEVETGEDAEVEDAEAIPESISPPAATPTIGQRQSGKRRVQKGTGTFETEGIRGG